ncbi:MAG TPA: ferritin family protein [Anaeromyxobacteraceae bacterium]|nr:ferritin family protein [Anaeromyxobacteraceae bacterium]
MAQTIDFAKLTLKDALDLAILIEEEARVRYEEFTKLVGGRYKGDADEVFKNMAAYESKHRDELKARRQKLFGAAPATVTLEALDDVEAPDRGQPRVFMSPRQAMEVALASEEKAYDFFDGALKHVKDADVRKLFEELRAEERQHQEYVKKAMATLPPGPDVEEEEADAPGSDAG